MVSKWRHTERILQPLPPRNLPALPVEHLNAINSYHPVGINTFLRLRNSVPIPGQNTLDADPDTLPPLALDLWPACRQHFSEHCFPRRADWQLNEGADWPTTKISPYESWPTTERAVSIVFTTLTADIQRPLSVLTLWS